MKILHTIAGFTPYWGGLTTATYDLLSALHGLTPEPDVDILAPGPKDAKDPLMGHGESWIHLTDNDCKTPLQISANVHEWLANHPYDIYHVNGMWLDIHHRTCAEARKRGKPYVITPHGMLYPSAMRISSWKKWPLRKLWFDRDIRQAACMHATCVEEMQYLRDLGYKGPVALIGNPVDVPDYTEQICEARAKRADCTKTRTVGFLGRLHPIKCVEKTLQGVALSGLDNVNIVLLGRGEEDYESFLRSEVERLGLEDRVRFAGFVNGREKFEELSRMDVLVVASEMENFGMIVPEALIAGTPVLASHGTPWQALEREGCGWWRDNSPESIAEVIREVASTDRATLFAMGMKGRQYIIDTFAAPAVARRMTQLYDWLGGNAPKPEFVYED